MSALLLWNVINLIDGEASWFLTFLLILAVAAVSTHAWRALCTHLQKKFIGRNELLKNAAIQASLLPVSCYIWFVAAIQSLDLVSDRFLSESFANGLKFVFTISAVLIMGWFLLRVNHNMRQVLLQKSKKQEIALDPGKVYGLAKLASIVILLVMALLLMEVTGVSVTTLIAFGGISGLALAFASQEIIANFFGGIMIHINQPFCLGDYISLPNSNLDGTVEEIGWYETCLRSKDKQPIYIPNALFSKAYVINGSRRSHRQINEKIAIRHQDLPKTRALLDEIRSWLQGHEAVEASHRVLVHIAQVGPYGVDITINCLSDVIDESQFLQFRDDFLVHVASVIKAHGAEIAIPVEAIVALENK